MHYPSSLAAEPAAADTFPVMRERREDLMRLSWTR